MNTFSCSNQQACKSQDPFPAMQQWPHWSILNELGLCKNTRKTLHCISQRSCHSSRFTVNRIKIKSWVHYYYHSSLKSVDMKWVMYSLLAVSCIYKFQAFRAKAVYVCVCESLWINQMGYIYGTHPTVVSNFSDQSPLFTYMSNTYADDAAVFGYKKYTAPLI